MLGIDKSASQHFNPFKYTGSNFHMTVHQYMSQNLDTRVNFKEKSRTLSNQSVIKQIKVGVLGAGQTFGDIDAYKERGYMYSLRTFSRHVEYYEISTEKFIMLINSVGKYKRFATYCKIHE